MANVQTVSAPIERQIGLRHIWDHVAQGIVGLILLLAVIAGVLTPALAYSWLRRPFLGAFFEQTNVYNAVLPTPGSEWALTSVFPAYGYRLTAVDGTPVTTSDDLRAALEDHRTGDEVSLAYRNEVEASRARDLGQPAPPVQTVAVRLTPFPLRDVLTYFLIPYVVGLCYLAIGLWVFGLRRNEAVGRAFAALCACAAIVLVTLFDLYTTHGFTRFWTAALPLAGGSLCALALIFPAEAAHATRWPGLRWIGFVPAILLAAVAEMRLYDYARPLAYAGAVGNGFLFIGLSSLFFIGMAAYRLWRAPSPIARERTRFILIGSAIAFVPVGLWLVASRILGAPWPFYASLYLTPLVAFPLVVGWIVLRYRLPNTDSLVSQALVYAVLGVLVAVGHGLLVAGGSLVLGKAVAADNPLVVGLLVFVLVVAFNPLRDRIQRAIDALFSRSGSARAQREMLQSLGHRLTRALDIEQIAAVLREQVTAALQPAHFHLFLCRPGTGDFAAYTPRGRPETDIRFARDGDLARALAEQAGVLCLTPEASMSASLAGDRARLAVLGSTILVPLPAGAGLAGWLALGPHAGDSGQPYKREDLAFLEAIADQAAVAVERAQVVADLERRLTDLTLLSQVSQAVNFPITFDDLLELVFAQVGKVLDTTNFHIVLRDPPTDTLSYVFFVERGERTDSAEGQPWPMGQGLASEIIRAGQPILTDDYRAECERRGVSALGQPYRAWLGVPLSGGAAGAAGAMVVAALDPGVTFTPDQLKILRALADQAATAIEKSRLYLETEQRARQLATLNSVAQSLASTLDLKSLLQQIVESAAEILLVEAGSLFLLDEATGEFVLTAAIGPVAPDLLGTRIPAGAGIVGTAANSGRPLIVNDGQNDPRVFRSADKAAGFVARALMAAPLRAKERTLGVIEVINRRDGRGFDADDQSLLQAFAGQAAVSIENARLYTLTAQALAARVDELSTLQRLDGELNTPLDVQKAVAITLDWAMRSTQAPAGVAGLAVGDGVLLLAVEGYGNALDGYRETPLPLDRGIIGRVVRTGKMSLVRDVRQDPDYVPARPSTESQLTVPIRREKDVIGVIALESDAADAFSEEQAEFISRLAEHASIAIANARLTAELRQATVAKSEFVSFVSHELKTPMTSIKGYTDLLAKGVGGPVGDMQAQFLDTIRANVERMSTLVSDLADISRIEAGRVRIDFAAIPLRAVIDAVAHSTAGQFEAKKQTLEVQVPADLPLIWANQARMAQVLTNLISNAYKYTPEGGRVVLRVEVGPNVWDPDGPAEVLHVSVKDNGIGIKPEEQKQIFSKFFRSQDRAVREVPGNGLGLSISKSLVELQGGQAWFESQPGAGSAFHFTIPVATAEQLAKGDARTA